MSKTLNKAKAARARKKWELLHDKTPLHKADKKNGEEHVLKKKEQVHLKIVS